MFNPYHARPIGSEKFEKHLLTLMIEAVELDEVAREAIPKYPLILTASQNERTEYDPIMEGYKALRTAILAQAVFDYLEEYEKRLKLEDDGRDSSAYVHECRCLTLENEFFREDDEGSDVLDTVLREVIHNQEDRYLPLRLMRIRNVKRRLQSVIHPYGGK